MLQCNCRMITAGELSAPFHSDDAVERPGRRLTIF
jgi:hypothetical protein